MIRTLLMCSVVGLAAGCGGKRDENPAPASGPPALPSKAEPGKAPPAPPLQPRPPVPGGG